MSRTMFTTSLARSFTLVEMMVGIAIVLLLSGLVLALGSNLYEQSERRETENLLRLLDSALAEWQVSSERLLTWGMDGSPAGIDYELDEDSDGDTQCRATLSVISRQSAAAAVLTQISTDMLLKDSANPGELTLNDSWGNPMVVVHPGRKPNPVLFVSDASATIDADGTIRTTAVNNPQWNENRLGVCENRRVCFVSAGPDGEFGNLQLEVSDPTTRDQMLVKQAADNLYSYPVLRENP